MNKCHQMIITRSETHVFRGSLKYIPCKEGVNVPYLTFVLVALGDGFARVRPIQK